MPKSEASARLSPTEECLRGIRKALRDERWGLAKKLAGQALAEGVPPRVLKLAFAAAGKVELLVRVLWRHRNDVFRNVGELAFFARLAAETESAEEYFARLHEWVPPSDLRHSTFYFPDCLTAYGNLDERLLLPIFRLKYANWEPFSGDAFQNASQYLDSIYIAPETTDFFYRNRSNPDIEFSVWQREFKIAQILHHVFSDAAMVPRFHRDADPLVREMGAKFCRMASFQDYVNMGEAKRLMEGPDRSQGLLVSTFHGGFLRISNFFFTRFMPDPYWLTVGSSGPNVIKVPGNERAAAFQTYRALKDGKAVLIAGDGFHFEHSKAATIEVLGLKTKISEGSAALAYEANCNTGWISASRRGNMFVPDYVPGPRRLPGESYKEFRERWVSFYAGQLQRAFSLGPENQVLVARWGSPNGPFWN